MRPSKTIHIACETYSRNTPNGSNRFINSQRSKTSHIFDIIEARDIFNLMTKIGFQTWHSSINWVWYRRYPGRMQLPQASDLAKYFSLTQTQKLLRYGNYYTQLKPFLKVFKEDEIIFFNGNRLGKILKDNGKWYRPISYGPYYMAHIIGPCHMDHFTWLI